ncbi:AsmA-like C-terminal region-containing protein [Pelagicoccus mobilis]|uniref:AsmA-like C-terminal domain-containing protein n=1 Tax=Pelagicoccus mobilis TaxID=415221 RepID=A0A934RYQ0_9BACT|nr:AsmA-like C-terminal region-containing protein [Pelagicoccus mobilis]MBK1878788.1 hypothetical protein [Pelagicoccus mobilis]
MSKPRKSHLRIAWKSVCTTCKALFHGCYSAIVLMLAAATLFAAYVATLDDIPVPNFIIRELRDQLQTKGISLRMEGIRFQPNGRIIVERPEFYSPELGSTIVAADIAIAKLKLSRLLFRKVAIDEVRLSSGRIVLPAMLTPSGEPTTAISSINLEAVQRAERWNIRYANCAIDDLKLSLAGRINANLLQLPPPKPDAPKPTVTQIILKLAPQISRVKEELKRLDAPFCTIDLDIEDGTQTAYLDLGATRLKATPEIEVQELSIKAKYALGQSLETKLFANHISLPNEVSAKSLRLFAQWDSEPPPKSLLPDHIQASTAQISYQGTEIPSLIALATPGETTHSAHIQLAFPSSPISARLEHDTESQQTSLDLHALLDTPLLENLNPLAQKFANLDLHSQAQIHSAIDIHATGTLDADFKPSRINAIAQTGETTLLGTTIDYASCSATLTGPQIDLHEVRLQAGQQSGVITVGYNLETMLRRVLIEGSFDPTSVNSWFKPWWAAMWDGMSFPDEGMLTYLDSQATFKRPDTVHVTGTGYVQDFNLRGMLVDELRTKLFSKFHYIDLYDLEINAADDQQAVGEIQFYMDRDVRDEKDKLTGIWIEAISTLDVQNGPKILWEIADGVRNILAPYCYDLPPLLEVRSASVLFEDEFINDIDLGIESETAFTFYGYPLDSLSTEIHIDDDVIDIPYAESDLGGGKMTASAFIVGDAVEIDAQLDDVGFGEALVATNTYFAADGSETAQAMDTERLLSFGGKANASFKGHGILGDSLSYQGEGEFKITEADFGSFRLFGLLSAALEITPLRFTTLSFSDASSPFTVNLDTVNLTDAKMEGGGAAIESEGTYNIETDALDLSAKLFPFRNSKVPLITPLINLPLDIFSNVFEVSVTGTFDEPKLTLFNPNTKQEINVDTPRRDHRPTRNPRSVTKNAPSE